MLEDDNKVRIKYKDGAEVKLPNKGLEALKKSAPEVVARMGYEEGGSVLDILSTLNEKQKDKIYKDFMKQRTNNLKEKYGNDLTGQILGGAINISEQIMSGLGGSGFDRVPLVTKADDELFLSLAKKELKRKTRQEGGSIDNQMKMALNEPDMLPDEVMEDNYMEFIMAEALSEEEEDMLTSKLEQDEQLAMLFDKVVDVAQEFAGSGPVEGPGSGVSDSIPARLSDGEFVFTAKAVEEIGEDSLMSMMKDAEAKADERLTAYNGGAVGDQLEKVVTTETRITKPADAMSPALGAKEDNMIQEEVTRNMLDPRVPHVRS